MTRAGMPTPQAVRTIASTSPITKAAAPRAEQAHLCITAPAICPASDRAESAGRMWISASALLPRFSCGAGVGSGLGPA